MKFHNLRRLVLRPVASTAPSWLWAALGAVACGCAGLDVKISPFSYAGIVEFVQASDGELPFGFQNSNNYKG